MQTLQFSGVTASTPGPLDMHCGRLWSKCALTQHRLLFKDSHTSNQLWDGVRWSHKNDASGSGLTHGLEIGSEKDVKLRPHPLSVKNLLLH